MNTPDIDAEQPGVQHGSKTEVPAITISRLALVSHDYNETTTQGYRDFTSSLAQILEYVDASGCDGVLFSLFTVDTSSDFNIKALLLGLSHVRALFLEEYEHGGGERRATRFVIYYKTDGTWKEYEFRQEFSKLQYTNRFKSRTIDPFLQGVKDRRLMGETTVLLCGESNVVKYSRTSKSIVDQHDYMGALPETVNVILNPIHDRMSRFEMVRKRKFLSRRDRWVVSVWNKGKRYSDGKTRKEKGPPWTVFRNEQVVVVPPEYPRCPDPSVEIGFLDLAQDNGRHDRNKITLRGPALIRPEDKKSWSSSKECIWLFGRGASVACNLKWAVPSNWVKLAREDLVARIESAIRTEMKRPKIDTSPYRSLLSELSKTRKPWRHLFATTNWDYLLQGEVSQIAQPKAPKWLMNSHVFHLNGTAEVLDDNSRRSSVLLETDPIAERVTSVEANTAYASLLVAQMIVVVGMSFQCEMDKGLLRALSQVEDELPIGEAAWLVVNSDREDRDRITTMVGDRFPHAPVQGVASNFGDWVKDGMPQLREAEVLPI